METSLTNPSPRGPSPEGSGWRLLLVDDHDLILLGLRAQLERVPDLRVVGTATTGSGALALVRELEPDVVLLDLRLAGQWDGFRICGEIKKMLPTTKVLLMTGDCPEQMWPQVTRCGADGYLLKEDPGQDYPLLIRQALAGRFVFSASLWRSAWESLVMVRSPSLLSPEQRQILELISQRRNNVEIADRIGCSESTVGKRLTALYRALGARGRGDVLDCYRRYLADGALGDCTEPGE